MHPIQEKLLKLSQMRDLWKLSYREIGRHLADSNDVYARVHPQTVKYHIDQLIKAGLLNAKQRPTKRVDSATTGINTNPVTLIRIPIVGSANCGPADIFADEKIEGYINVSPTKLRSKNYNDLFALRAVGESMNISNINGQPITDGDYVVVDATRKTPKEGERVVIIHNDMANIKRIFFDEEEQVVVLRSESTIDYSPIYVDPNDNWDGLISGTVIQVIKDRGTPALA